MKRFAGFLAALVLLVAGTSQAYADHVLAADLSWTPSGVNTIRFRGQVYFRTDEVTGTGGLSADSNLVLVGNVYCEPLGAGGLRLYYGDGGNSGDLCFRILEVNHLEGWFRAIAVLSSNTGADGITHTYANPGPWNAEILGCCRIDHDVNNRVEESFRLMATVFANGNSSPVATLGQLPILAVPQACASGEFVTFQMLASDPNGNPIAWSLANNLQATNDPTANGPDSEGGYPGLSINNAGVVTWYNYGIDNILPWTVQFYACDATTCTPIDLLLVLQACTFQEDGACTGTIGYWKNHGEAWPVDAITLGAVNYTKAQAIALLQTPSKGDKTIDLAHQLIGAKLNVAHGADNSCISQTITNADAFLILHPVGSNVKASSAAWTSTGGALHSTLGDYNEGELCAPHRDSDECEEGSDLQ
jgi:hypothetical protein